MGLGPALGWAVSLGVGVGVGLGVGVGVGRGSSKVETTMVTVLPALASWPAEIGRAHV